MKIINKENCTFYLSDGIESVCDCVLALGNFDGLHVAHKELIIAAQELKSQIGASFAGVWCFGENPLKFFMPDPPKRVMPSEERIKLFFECGIDFCVVASFEAYRGADPEEFIREHLSGELGCRGVVCGYNFKFGKDRGGTPDMLRGFFGEDNTRVINKIEIDGIPVSSSQIRKFISEGDIPSANKFLGRPYFIDTVVSKGKKLGRKLNFPTANQFFPEDCVLPKFGIYATICTTETGETHVGVSNVGIRPTISEGDSHAVNCETYIIGFSGDLYGKRLKVEFYKLLRLEHKFNSVENLRDAIEQDAKNALAYFAGSGAEA